MLVSLLLRKKNDFGALGCDKRAIRIWLRGVGQLTKAGRGGAPPPS